MNDALPFWICLLAPPVLGELALLFLIFKFHRRRNTREGGPAGILFLTGSLLLMPVLAFGGGEFYYRFVFDSTDALAVTRVCRRWVDRYTQLNDAGYRDDVPYERTPKPGARRVSFIGDSFTAGHGIKRIEDRFANRIRAQHPDWDIHVLAKPGNDTGAELDRLRGLREAGYTFDLVVLVYCLNDVADLFPEWTETSRRVFDDPRRDDWLLRHSYFADLMYQRRRVAGEPLARDYYGFVREGYVGAIWEKQRERLKEFARLVRADGGTLLVVTFPFLQKPGGEYGFTSAHDELAGFWKTQSVPHLDLREAFAGEEPSSLIVNPDDPHPNEKANRIAAERIQKFIEENLAGRLR